MIDVLDTLHASLAPHYDVEREIGAGGMARVFLAVEQHPHRRVAIKAPDPEVAILLSGEHAIVADFGIARAISAAGSLTLTQAGQPIGSPGYMSPEQAMALGDLDARTDLYSLGCVLFEMLAGESPAASMTERRVHNWTRLEASAAMKRADAGVARAVKHAISRALAPLPDDRFPSVTEFAAALGGSPRRPGG